jgi:phospholipid/cholesterol/gamma-HCH transport system permease protein
VIAWTGRKTVEGAAYAVDVLFLGYLAFKELLTPSRRGRGEAFRVIASQILFTGVDALPVVSAIALMLGIIIIIQAGITLPQVGAGAFLANVIMITVVRELGPLLTAFIVVWRSGTAMCTELGNMRVGQEIAALDAMGISLIRFLVMPRVIGAIVSVICLTVYFDLVAVIGGFLVAKVKLTIPFAVYLTEIEKVLSIADVLITVIKSSLFGLATAVICCHHGLSVVGATTEVPQQTTRAMLNTVTVCLVLDIIVSIGFYL